MCYYCPCCTEPSYVIDILHKPLHPQNTHLSMPLLNMHAHSNATIGDHSFPFHSSSVKNSNPNCIRCAPSLSPFKSHLKEFIIFCLKRISCFILMTSLCKLANVIDSINQYFFAKSKRPLIYARFFI